MEIEYPFRFRWNKAIEARFRAAPIYLRHHDSIEGVFRDGEEVTLRCPILVEPFATMPEGDFLSLSAFSYSMSAMSQDTRVGRYCSIAKNVEKLGIAHPTDRITTHVVSFRHYYVQMMRDNFGKCAPRIPFDAEKGPVVIGNDVWIGQDVLIQQGVTVGDGRWSARAPSSRGTCRPSPSSGERLRGSSATASRPKSAAARWRHDGGASRPTSSRICRWTGLPPFSTA